MKKLLSIFLAFLLLSSNTGLAISVHYCGGKVASVKSGFTSGQGCGMEAKTAKTPGCTEAKPVRKTCCDDKTVQLKSKSAEQIVKMLQYDVAGFVAPDSFILQFISQKERYTERKVRAYTCDANAPPLFKLYSSYIFYA